MSATTKFNPSFTIAGAILLPAGERALPQFSFSLSLSLPIGCRA